MIEIIDVFGKFDIFHFLESADHVVLTVDVALIFNVDFHL